MILTNLFKEKKKSYKRYAAKNSNEVDSEEEKLKEMESHLIKNKKIKISYPKPKQKKTQKTLNDLILKKESEEIDSKSTQAFSKKTENLFDNSKKADIIMKEENDKNAHLLELSEETKNIMNLIYNKKRKEKLNKINNKENDYSLLTIPDEQN